MIRIPDEPDASLRVGPRAVQLSNLDKILDPVSAWPNGTFWKPLLATRGRFRLEEAL